MGEPHRLPIRAHDPRRRSRRPPRRGQGVGAARPPVPGRPPQAAHGPAATRPQRPEGRRLRHRRRGRRAPDAGHPPRVGEPRRTRRSHPGRDGRRPGPVGGVHRQRRLGPAPPRRPVARPRRRVDHRPAAAHRTAVGTARAGPRPRRPGHAVRRRHRVPRFGHQRVA